MLRRLLERAVLWVASDGLLLIVGRGSNWEVLARAVHAKDKNTNSGSTVEGLAPSLAHQRVDWSDSLTRLVSSAHVHRRLRSIPVSGVLAPDLTAAMLINLGTEPLLRQTRLRFAQHRMRQCFGAEIDACRVFLDEATVTGTALVFAAPSRLLEALQSATLMEFARMRSAVPAMTWCWNVNRSRRLERGWFGLVDSRSFVLARVLEGRPVALNAAMDPPQSDAELAAALRREAFRLGVDADDGTVVIIDARSRVKRTASADGFRIAMAPVLPNIAIESDDGLRAAA